LVLLFNNRNNDVLGVTSVVVSHDVEEISRIADHCYVVSGGRVIGAGTPTDLGRSDSPLIRQFMSGEVDRCHFIIRRRRTETN
jgi:phospholipid/cholesterol/gamma-HCH transport system ATP-binding protein